MNTITNKNTMNTITFKIIFKDYENNDTIKSFTTLNINPDKPFDDEFTFNQFLNKYIKNELAKNPDYTVEIKYFKQYVKIRLVDAFYLFDKHAMQSYTKIYYPQK